MPLTLGYWNIRGLAHPIRMLLHYVGEEYTEKLYESGPAPEFNGDQWYSEKFNLGLAYPNLPYLIDGDFKLTESKAIMRYIGRKHNLVGQTPKEMAIVDMLLDVQTGYSDVAYSVFYSPDFNDKKAGLKKTIEDYFQRLEDNSKGKKWFVGDNITIADFLMYEYFKRMMAFHEGVQGKFAWITQFVDNFEALPAIKKYLSSESVPSQFNGDMAYWGGKKG